MDAATSTGSHQDARSDEDPQDMQKEILPDSIVGLLRRMAEEIKCSICLGTLDQPKVTPCNHTFCDDCIRQALVRREECPLCKNRFSKRSLNSVEHLEKVVNAFHDLTAEYALEYGQSLSQAPRHYDVEPIENLTQFFPYPEKDDGSSPRSQPTTPAADEEEEEEEETVIQVTELPKPANPSNLESTIATTTTDQEPPSGLDLSCFDVDLDLLSTEDAALLAEQMLNMMLHVQDDPKQAAPVSTSVSSDHPTQQPPSAQSEPPQVLQVKQEDDEQYRPSPSAQSTQPIQPTQPSQPSQARSSLAKFNPEFATSLPQSNSESFFADIPTQEQASAETKIVLCGTYLSPQKKRRSKVEMVAEEQ
ncbi:hypothetical protein BGZ75_007323 [Mortierella antarctica]|nr:hypothetical protein BGZ75_007323 [Mortierella antarctica]